MIERMIDYSGKNPLIVLLGVVFLSVWGYWAVIHTPLDAIPDLSDVQVIVYTEWEGRSPNLIEDQITYPIVTSMLGAPKVKYVRGSSDFGFSYVYIVFEDGTDMYWARSRVLEFMSKVSGKLPEGVRPVLGPDATGVGWVYEYALVDHSGKRSLADIRAYQDWTLKYQLQSIPGVAEVASVGGFEKQYQVHVNPQRLLALNIPFTRVTQAIRMANKDVGGRSIELSEREYMVRGQGYIKSLTDLELIPLGVSKSGVPILLKDISHVTVGPEMRRGVTELNGEGEVVGGIVIMRYGENALKVIERVKEKIAEIQSGLPTGLKIVPTYDRSGLILRAIATLKEKLIEVTLVVSGVTIIFLFHFRSALVAIISLPIAILLSFIAMSLLHLTSNVMSLGGIAIAIGAMADGAIVMIENAHRRLEEEPEKKRSEVILAAAKELGKPLFFSLLIITVSFMPIFTLEAQEGRLFKPLAFTKTFSMFFSAFLSITLIPLLMVFLIRGKITPVAKNPINRFLIRLYEPALRFVLKRPVIIVASAVALFFLTIPIFLKMGSEFMPPLNEGTILYMPTTLPGISITKASQILQQQDALLKRIPEVETVFGKIGRADTSTDSAPISMGETTITLKPEDQWRPGMTQEKLISEMDQAVRFPGIPNIFWMPIQTRTEMLATGVRSALGIKIYGKDLDDINRIGSEIEGVLSGIPGTRSAFSERVSGGYFIDFKIDRQKAARYDLSVSDIEEIIESAIGGVNVTTIISGRERYSVNVRYPQELRDDINKLGRVLVPAPTGVQIPMVQLADISISTGAPMIKDENGSLAGIVYVDVTGRDLGGYVQEAKEKISQKIDLKGTTLGWVGSYQYLLRAKERFKIIIPLTLLAIFVLLYLNFNSISRSFLVLLTVPFSLIGGVLLLYILNLFSLHYNLSVAVWVGFIALAGVATEIGVIMIVYLDQALKTRQEKGSLENETELIEGIVEGAVRRIRPIVMTATAIIAGLVPILWSHGTGAEVMKRIAVPMVGGMVSTTFLTLFVIPAIYLVWQRRKFKKFEKRV
ncbi:MAG: efflux RND transporter permease subunit [Nitrospirae bacterium]|nr:efflux RND transporter permease subunit [Nitrospirota bacterium]